MHDTISISLLSRDILKEFHTVGGKTQDLMRSRRVLFELSAFLGQGKLLENVFLVDSQYSNTPMPLHLFLQLIKKNLFFLFANIRSSFRSSRSTKNYEFAGRIYFRNFTGAGQRLNSSFRDSTLTLMPSEG